METGEINKSVIQMKWNLMYDGGSKNMHDRPCCFLRKYFFFCSEMIWSYTSIGRLGS